MTKEVIELQEGKILRGKYAKDEIINLFKNSVGISYPRKSDVST